MLSPPLSISPATQLPPKYTHTHTHTHTHTANLIHLYIHLIKLNFGFVYGAMFPYPRAPCLDVGNVNGSGNNSGGGGRAKEM